MDNIKVEMILAQRHSVYGDYSTTALIAQQLKGMMHEAPSWHKLTASQREGLEMIQHKIARIVNGDPSYLDSFVDIIGYAKLMVEEMEKKHGTTK